jgi:hypothetical protein
MRQREEHRSSNERGVRERKPMEKSPKRKALDAKALAKHKKRFLRFFPKAFRDQRYIDWERTYKWEAHKLWVELLNQEDYKTLLRGRDYPEIATRALQVESRTNFLFSFEKMALRDAVRTGNGARIFSDGLYNLLYERGPISEKFIAWIVSVFELPRKQSRVASWPIVTFFPFIAQPSKHIILKPTAMRIAAEELGYDFDYSSKPSYRTYESLLDFANLTKIGISDLKPQDFHDIQSFLWTIGSAEYERLSHEI